MALGYVARFATSAGKLRDYCRRKLRERGWEGADEGAPPPDVEALVGRMVRAGYVDDAGFARMKAGALRRRGLGSARVEQTLRAAGIADEVREDVRGSELERRDAAVTLARRRRLGPFAVTRDPALREKQLATLIRAGHPLDIARRIVDAEDEATLDEWLEEANDNGE